VSRGLDEEDVRLLVGDRPVLDALRHDVEVARAELDVPSRSSIRMRPFRTRKKSSVSSCLCHDERPLHLHHHEVVAVELADRPRLVVLGEGGELPSRLTPFMGAPS
jgi:hypothetical protein